MKLDLNSSSAFGKRIKWFIDNGLTEKEEAQREYLGVSVIGDKCDRKLQFMAMCACSSGKKFKPDKQPDGRIRRIFSRGHWIEEMVVKWLVDAGFDIRYTGEEQLKIKFLDKPIKISGHSDGVIFGHKTNENMFSFPALLEVKGLGEKYFKELEKVKLKKYSQTYYTQVQVYMLGLQLERCLFVACNANTMDLYFELVELDFQFARNQLERAKFIVNKASYQLQFGGNELLPKITSDPSFHECKYFCNYYNTCWGMNDSES